VTHTLEVRGLRVLAVIGVLAEERERPQPLAVDLDVDLDVVPHRDEVDATVDYAMLCELAISTLQATQPRLLETACELVGAAILGADPMVRSVTTAVVKLAPPVAFDVDSVGVRHTVTR
jgi:dihydroneopterin aldolase